MLEVLGRDFIRALRAKGLPERRVIWQHALKNALIPVVTVIGLQMAIMLAGAVLTALIGLARRRLGLVSILDSLVEALRTSVAIYTILIGAILFGYFLAVTQTPQKITAFLTSLDLGAHGTLALILVFFVFMGCILDAMAMIILLVPIVYPVVTQLGFDPIWFGVIIVMTVELGLITPPVGMNVFVINSIARDISLPKIFRGVLPFVGADIIRLVLLIMFPWIVMFLPLVMVFAFAPIVAFLLGVIRKLAADLLVQLLRLDKRFARILHALVTLQLGLSLYQSRFGRFGSGGQHSQQQLATAFLLADHQIEHLILARYADGSTHDLHILGHLHQPLVEMLTVILAVVVDEQRIGVFATY